MEAIAQPDGPQDVHTFVFADLAGFTALTEAHGDQLAADLALDFAAKVNEWLTPLGGGDLKLIGDAVMIRCSEAGAAVELALRIIERLPNLGDYPAVRIGMNTGPAVSRDGDWFGAAVNLAARVAAQAAGGEVLATLATHYAAGDLESVNWDPHGEHRFKNVRDATEIFRVRRRHSAPDSMVTDPVCRMKIDAERAVGRLRHDGMTYSFCSLDCAGAFASEPSTYST